MFSPTSDNLLINGNFLPDLWSHSARPDSPLTCDPARETFAADRWYVRAARPHGAPIFQKRSLENSPPRSASAHLELHGAPDVDQAFFVGQKMEADDACRYRHRLHFSGWFFLPSGSSETPFLRLQFSTPNAKNEFTTSVSEAVKIEHSETIEIIDTNVWTYVEREIDARHFRPYGLCTEIEFSHDALASSSASVRLSALRLVHANAAGRSFERPAAIERLLAKRFFQCIDSNVVNSIGRALVVNQHELHFQLTFPEMRIFPACTLPHDNAYLRVFNLEGLPQESFVYDVTYRSRGSVIIRATKENHGLSDAFLSFVGNSAAILLDAEL